MEFKVFIISFLWAYASCEKESRIIGGDRARAGQFPWQAAIYIDNVNGRYFCGGAIVANQWILTAGQCVIGVKTFTIQLGANTLLTGDPNRLVVSSSTAIVHPQYNQTSLENDIGLIKLHMPVEFTDYISSIDVAPAGEIDQGVLVTVVGWGQTTDHSSINNNLYYADLAIISNNECQITYGNQIKSGMVCATGNYNEGICIGDTGSPLLKTILNDKLLLVGIASFMSQNGCENTDPSGFTRADNYQDWVYKTINQS